MNYRVKFTPQAESDIHEAAEYIAAEFGNATVLRFQGSLEALTELIAMFPYATQVYDDDLGVRKFSILKYPYTLYLRIDDDLMEVIAFTFLHQKRDPLAIHKLILKRLGKD
jgi:plasmid stabilization system protein ParE